jgi:hypothetical protein
MIPESRPINPCQSCCSAIVGRRIRTTPRKPSRTEAISRPSTRAVPSAMAPPIRKSAIHTDDM